MDTQAQIQELQSQVAEIKSQNKPAQQVQFSPNLYEVLGTFETVSVAPTVAVPQSIYDQIKYLYLKNADGSISIGLYFYDVLNKTWRLFPTTTSNTTSATTGSMTVYMTSSIITVTPSANCTFNASGGQTGQRATFYITASGVSSFTLTFGTNFKSTGTLATGTSSGRVFTVTFICVDGTTWAEEARTVAM